MKMNLKLVAMLAALAMPVAAQASDDPFEKAMEVYGCGDYPKALKAFFPLAEAGDRWAQYQVGMMLEQGQGAEADLRTAYDWYMKAAKQGVADAYFALGQIYSRGQVVAADPVKAYSWFDLAVQAGHKVAVDWRNMEAPKLGPADLQAARKIMSDWLEKVRKP